MCEHTNSLIKINYAVAKYIYIYLNFNRHEVIGIPDI